SAPDPEGNSAPRSHLGVGSPRGPVAGPAADLCQHRARGFAGAARRAPDDAGARGPGGPRALRPTRSVPRAEASLRGQLEEGGESAGTGAVGPARSFQRIYPVPTLRTRGEVP